MRQRLDVLNNVHIVSPCPTSWEGMQGDDSSRHCSACKQTVYNLSTMTADEANSLLAADGDSVCVRLYKRLDGTVITRDYRQGIRHRMSRILNRVSVAAASLFGVAIIAGCNPRSEEKCWMGKPAIQNPEKKTQIDKERNENEQHEKEPNN